MDQIFRQIISRELGGVSRYANRGHHVGWQTPTLVSDMYLERLETANCDHVNLLEYCEGLPIVCQFGRGAYSHMLAVTDEDGQVSIFSTEPGQRQLPRVHYWQAHDNAVFDYLWVNGDSQCLTAAGDQTVALWDSNCSKRITRFNGHTCSVRSLAARPGSTAQFASGARDGHIMLWDTRVNKKAFQGTNLPAKSIKYAHSLATRVNLRRHRRIHRAAGPKGVMDTQQSVTCVLYHTENVLISSGANDGCVKLWDTRKWYTNSNTSLPQPLHTFHYPGHMRRLKGIVTMCVDPWKSRLFVSYTDSKVYRYELAGAYSDPVDYVYAGHRNDTFFMRCAVSPDGKYLLSGSGRNTGVIWEVDRPDKRPVFLVGHTEDVSAVDWCPHDLCKLATLSDDMSVKVWRPDIRERHTEDPSIMGFSFSASIGKWCQRQSQIHIVQDEFPFSLPGPSSNSRDSPTHSAYALPQLAEPSMRQVFRVQHQALRCSPRKLGKSSSPGAPTSPLAGPSQGVPSSPGSGNRKKDSGIVKGYNLRNQQHCNSAESSSSTPNKNGGGLSSLSSSPLQFCSYALRSSLRDCSQHSSSKELSPYRSQRCGCGLKKGKDAEEGLSPVSSKSPRKLSPGNVRRSPRVCRCRSSPVTHSPRGKGLTAVKSPKQLLSPTKSPHRYGEEGCRMLSNIGIMPRRQLFSSPTASLPNRVLDNPPLKPSTSAHTLPEKKVDWLTRYRLTKFKTSESPAMQERNTAPSGSSPRLPGEKSPATAEKDKDGGKNVTPKRKASILDEVEEEEEETPSKRKKGERTPTSSNTRRNGSFSKSGSSRTPRHRLSSSPKMPTNMSIKKYLQ